jgi:glycerol-3-phosphate dehydrogenase
MEASLSPAARTHALTTLTEDRFDLLVVGGGITGAGVARDAALRGLRVALVEATDFAAGTSSRSSKLIHGGVRYLAQGDVALVREAASERATLRRIAPHLATSLTMVMPTHGRGTHMKLGAGLWAFEKLASIPAHERHAMWSREEALANEPALAGEQLYGAAAFTEYLTDDARLVLENVKGAVAAGAVCANHAEATRIGPGVVEVRDTLGGATHEVRARLVVNAAGPWVGDVFARAGVTSGRALQLTTGIHLVVDGARLPLRHAVVMQARDKRSVFAVPRDDVAYLGTTDTLYGEAVLSPEITADDAQYLLDAANRTFAGTPLGEDDVIGGWAGLRPLLAEPGKSPSEISRRDEIMVDEATGLVSIAGGKLTTYRRMAERVVDLVCTRLGMTVAPCRTGDVPVPAARTPLPTIGDLRAVLPALGDADAGRLIRLYGAEASPIVARAAGLEASDDLPALRRAEIEHALDHEMALTLEDVLERRTRLLLFDPQQGLDGLESVGHVAAERLGWSPERTADEVRHYRQLAASLRSFT